MMNGHADIRAQLAGIPARLHSIFLPQLQQLGAQVFPVPYGVAARLDSAVATGWFWAFAVDDDCLVTTMHLVAHRSFTLHEEPAMDYRVLGLLSRVDTGLVNAMRREHAATKPDDPFEGGFSATLPQNALAFSMRRGPREFTMEAESLHDSCNICMLPMFLVRMCELLGESRPSLVEAFDKGIALNETPRLLQTLHAIDPTEAMRAGAPLHYRALVLEALAEMSSSLAERERDPSAIDLRHNKRIADAVSSALLASLADPPTLDELSGRLYLGRTQLCQRFRDETGTSIGEYLARLRLEEAKRRLSRGSESIAAIAHGLGYAHTSSFSAMFARHEGMGPSAWRKKHGAKASAHGGADLTQGSAEAPAGC